MIILGVNAFHGDSSAALVRDGVLVAAVEEERFRRIKHWAGFPSQAISYCLREAKIGLGDLDHLAINQDNSAHLVRKMFYSAFHRPNPALLLQRLTNRKKRSSIPEILERAFLGQSFRGQSHGIEHHLCHLYSAFYVSPFQDSVIASVDGFGDFSSAAWGTGHGRDLAINGRVFFPHSLGVFYQALTQFLGFPHYGDEYKVMGLAPYGQPTFMKEMREIVQLQSNGFFKLNLRYFRHHSHRVPYQWSDGSPEIGDLFSPELEDLLGPRRNSSVQLSSRDHDIARSVQAMYEEAFFHLIRVQQEESGLTKIALAGGCAANSVANGKVRRMTRFTQVYIQAAAGDAGGAIGAAFAVHNKLGGKREFVMDHAYFGPHYSEEEIDNLVKDRRADIEAAGCTIEKFCDEDILCRRTASEIAKGKVIGWFQGRLEWGPRALGNRSIICDPRRADMKTILNAKIKRRESFRPFAPSVLREAVSEWFEEDDAVPFMMQVFQIREHRRAEIPAVTHVDGSGRLQTVEARTNPKYHKLISSFCDLTGVPMVLNTSFNENEPVVCQPEEAMDCFLRTRMDVLVLGNTFVQRSDVFSAL